MVGTSRPGTAVTVPSPPQALAVWLDDPAFGPLARIGTLSRVGGEGVRFDYDRTWLTHAQAFRLDPRLELGEGTFYPSAGTSNFGVFLDSCPDRWGQVLMQRREVVQARSEGRKPQVLRAWDFLLGVQDVTRLGALRFSAPGAGPAAGDSRAFLANEALSAPPITSLPQLEAAAIAVTQKKHDDLQQLQEWLKVLVAPGSSLGGARPKANVREIDGSLWIAKFPAADDTDDVGLREKLLHDLARACGIDVPASRHLKIGDGYHTFMVQRFDRAAGRRRFFTSAMTALSRGDNEGASYLDLAAFLWDHGCKDHIESDLRQLFRRVVFNVLTANRDDHLRNHGFLRHLDGWRLAPAYDINASGKRDTHTLALDEACAQPDIDVVLATFEYYRLPSLDAAAAIHAQVLDGLRSWPQRARHLGLGALERAELEILLP